MEQNKQPKRKGSGMRVVWSLIITAVVGLVYFYVALPPINLHAEAFYGFVVLLALVYLACTMLFSGMGTSGTPQEIFGFIKRQGKFPAAVLIVLLVVFVVGSVISMPLLRASAYRDLLTVEDGNFAEDVTEISFDEIPLLDEDSAMYLASTQMGTLSDMVSQFEVSTYYNTQINYQGRPVRVVPLEYADLFKWLTNRSNGLPAYIVVDMVSQQVDVVRLPEGQGMHFSPSEPLNRNIMRHLRFQYPTFMFDTPTFEIDEEGNPWWVCPRLVKTIGLFGGTDIHGAVLVNAVTGESQYYASEDIPSWVDRVYLASLITAQYDYHGLYVNGFWNSIFGQKDVTRTTEGYNYIAINDDVYMYTGVTSVSSDQSNLGFLLCNQRTKETHFYRAPGATEQAARRSAEGVVQDLGYRSTFPLLLNIAGQPTYFMALKDDSQLVKQYAMVNVSQYSTVVSTAATVAQCEQEYLELLTSSGLADQEDLPVDTVSGAVAEVRSAVIDGNTWFYIRLEGGSVYYTISAADSSVAPLLKAGDQVTITFDQDADPDSYQLPARSLEARLTL